MREYEVTVILKSTISEEEHAQLIERLDSWLVPSEEDRATLLKPKHWGLRKMAYPIKKHTEGYYAFYEVQLETNVIDDIERQMQYNENILRYMFIRKEEDAVVAETVEAVAETVAAVTEAASSEEE